MEPAQRRRLVFGAAIVISAVFLYAISFGPMVGLITLAERHRLMPKGAEGPLTVLFFPHLWVCYHSESYFHYIGWWVGASSAFTWNDFREKHREHFGQ